MKKFLKFTSHTILFCFYLVGGGLSAQTFVLPANLINLNSDRGEKLLLESEARQDYIPLSIQFVTQDNLAYCGVASMVMVLNALAVPAPTTSQYRNWRIFTQENVFNQLETQRVMTPEQVTRRGMSLAELGKLLETYPVKAIVYYGSDVTLEQFRNLIVKNLTEVNNFVLVNYSRPAIGQEGGGHISPIAAYDRDSDRFLILDVSRYKYPPVWVKVEKLWQATKTIDSASGKTRGLVLVSRLDGANVLE
jgi:hypothetical protein